MSDKQNFHVVVASVQKVSTGNEKDFIRTLLGEENLSSLVEFIHYRRNSEPQHLKVYLVFHSASAAFKVYESLVKGQECRHVKLKEMSKKILDKKVTKHGVRESFKSETPQKQNKRKLNEADCEVEMRPKKKQRYTSLLHGHPVEILQSRGELSLVRWMPTIFPSKKEISKLNPTWGIYDQQELNDGILVYWKDTWENTEEILIQTEEKTVEKKKEKMKKMTKLLYSLLNSNGLLK